MLVLSRARIDARHRARLRRQLPNEREQAGEVPADDGFVQVNRIVLAEVRLELVAPLEQDVGERYQFFSWAASMSSCSMRTISSMSS